MLQRTIHPHTRTKCGIYRVQIVLEACKGKSLQLKINNKLQTREMSLFHKQICILLTNKATQTQLP